MRMGEGRGDRRGLLPPGAVRGAAALLACALASACAGGAPASPTPEPFWPATAAQPALAAPALEASPPAASPECQPDARFVQDLTVPDGMVVPPGAAIDKRWEVLNSGTCDWGPGYRLVRLGADPLEGPGEIALYPARAGAAAVWQVLLTAPSAPGEVISRWQARSPDGRLFGEEVYLMIVVSAPSP